MGTPLPHTDVVGDLMKNLAHIFLFSCPLLMWSLGKVFDILPCVLLILQVRQGSDHRRGGGAEEEKKEEEERTKENRKKEK